MLKKVIVGSSVILFFCLAQAASQSTSVHQPRPLSPRLPNLVLAHRGKSPQRSGGSLLRRSDAVAFSRAKREGFVQAPDPELVWAAEVMANV